MEEKKPRVQQPTQQSMLDTSNPDVIKPLLKTLTPVQAKFGSPLFDTFINKFGQVAIAEFVQFMVETTPSREYWAHHTLLLKSMMHSEHPCLFDELLKLLQLTDYPDTRRNAIYYLGELGDQRAIEPLFNDYLYEEDNNLNVTCMDALAKLGDERVGDLFMQRLNSDSHKIRANAAQSLGNLKYQQATQDLINIVANPREGWLPIEKAAEALGKISDPMAVPILISALTTAHRNAMPAIIKALQAIDTPEAKIAIRDYELQ